MIDTILWLLMIFAVPVVITVFIVIGGKSFSWVGELYHAWWDRVEKLKIDVWNLKIGTIENATQISKTCGWGLFLYAVILSGYGAYWHDPNYYVFSLLCIVLGTGFIHLNFFSAILSVVIWPLLIAYQIYDIDYSEDNFIVMQEVMFLIDDMTLTIIMMNGIKAVFHYQKMKNRLPSDTKNE